MIVTIVRANSSHFYNFIEWKEMFFKWQHQPKYDGTKVKKEWQFAWFFRSRQFIEFFNSNDTELNYICLISYVSVIYLPLFLFILTFAVYFSGLIKIISNHKLYETSVENLRSSWFMHKFQGRTKNVVKMIFYVVKLIKYHKSKLKTSFVIYLCIFIRISIYLHVSVFPISTQFDMGFYLWKILKPNINCN